MEALLRKGVYTAVCVLLSIMGGKGGQVGGKLHVSKTTQLRKTAFYRIFSLTLLETRPELPPLAPPCHNPFLGTTAF